MKKLAWLLLLLIFASCLPKKEVLRNPSAGRQIPPVQTERGGGGNTGSTSRSNGGMTDRSKGTGGPAGNVLAGISGKPGVIPAGIDYIGRYQNIALEEMQKHGIPASIKLAQALLESGYGNSRLALEANNHFGIKCTSDWPGGRSYHDDDEKNDCFRVYNTPEESFRDHSSFLLRRRYEKLFQLDRYDYKAWAHGLKEAGYATNPRYPALLIDLIERYELYRLDRLDFSAQSSKGSQTVSRPVESPTKKEPAPKQEPPVSQSDPVRQSDPTKHRQMKIHEVAPGESITGIARQYGLSIEQLMALNGLKTQDLNPGQLLVVSK